MLTVRDISDETLQATVNLFDNETVGAVVVIISGSSDIITVTRLEAFQELARRIDAELLN